MMKGVREGRKERAKMGRKDWVRSDYLVTCQICCVLRLNITAVRAVRAVRAVILQS